MMKDLVKKGKMRLEWARDHMPVINKVKELGLV